MKFSSGSLQLNLPIQPSKRAASRDDLPDQLARLTPAERTILQLKALVGIVTNKNDFLALLNRSGIPMPGGPWSYNSVNPILNRLLALGLLKPDLSCVDTLCHDLTVEAIAAPGGRVAAEAVRRMFPVAANRPYYHSYSPQTDPGARQAAVDNLRK